jgi:hypothetical protein
MSGKMLHLGDLQRNSKSDQLFAFSEAYLDSAAVLCKEYCKTKDDLT